MCLIAWNWQPQSATPLLLVANRDEYYARPTLPLHWWTDADILAGRDTQAGGTWLGVSRSGRLAALTNHRSPKALRADTPSRGELVSQFLQTQAPAADFLAQLATRAGNYNPFNLLVFDGQNLMGLESRHAHIITLPVGVGAVSNADFHSPWPKLVGLQSKLQAQLDQGQTADAALLELLHDTQLAPEHLLPQTGIPLPFERQLSATFVATPDYGTRACSVVRLQTTGGSFLEQTCTNEGMGACQHVTWTTARGASKASTDNPHP